MVSLTNAYYYLTRKRIGDREYDNLADACGCVAGSCINIKPALERLGMEVKRYRVTLPVGRAVLPLEINIWHKFCGFHSVLAVDWEPKTKAFRITNFNHVVTARGWIFHEDLMHYVILNPDKTEPRWRSRTFALKVR